MVLGTNCCCFNFRRICTFRYTHRNFWLLSWKLMKENPWLIWIDEDNWEWFVSLIYLQENPFAWYTTPRFAIPIWLIAHNNIITILHKQAQCRTIWYFLKGTSWCKPTKLYCKKATQQQEKEENLKNNNKCMSPRYLLGFYPLMWKTLESSSGIEEFI